MVKHQETHPGLDVPGCFGCKAASVAFAPSATPSRGGGAEAARITAKEKEWARDMRAYRALRRNGLQPPQIDGSHRLEGATDKLEVEHGHLFRTPEERKEVRAQMTAAAEYMSENGMTAS